MHNHVVVLTSESMSESHDVNTRPMGVGFAQISNPVIAVDGPSDCVEIGGPVPNRDDGRRLIPA